jgi:hypothetical protein
MDKGRSMIRGPRTPLKQEFTCYPVTVGVVPAPVNAALSLSSLISTIAFSVPTGAANSVFLGPDASVSITTGLEIPPGIVQQYRTNNERELIELESPLLSILFQVLCFFGIKNQVQGEEVPLVVWDLSQMYLVATAPTAMVVGTFKEIWI